jgi:1-acyl-sn-glycerol-3-phosphate acyltransferase
MSATIPPVGVVAKLLLSSPSGFEDEWGFDEGLVEEAMTLLDYLYERWWRVHAEGVTNVPGHGGALIVANHAGVLPWDAGMIATAIMREHPLPRYARFTVSEWALQLPFVSVSVRRLGGVVSSPHNVSRLLEQGELVSVFPEGANADARPWADRYHVGRFGRGGFVALAMRAGVPIVPCAIVGSEEIYPRVTEAPGLARLLGARSVPMTPTFPLLGPLGLVPLPSRWRIEFCEPVSLEAHGPDAADDRNLVFDIAEEIRAQIQAKVHENVVKRQGAFL